MNTMAPCLHDELDCKGRCTQCGEWAVVTGQFRPEVSGNAVETPEHCANTMCSRPAGHDGLHKPWGLL